MFWPSLPLSIKPVDEAGLLNFLHQACIHYIVGFDAASLRVRQGVQGALDPFRLRHRILPQAFA